jgi:hypothetical protein
MLRDARRAFVTEPHRASLDRYFARLLRPASSSCLNTVSGEKLSAGAQNFVIAIYYAEWGLL